MSATCGSDLEVAHVLTCVWNSTNVCFPVPVSQHVMHTHAYSWGAHKPSSQALFSRGGGRGEGGRVGSFCYNPRLVQMPQVICGVPGHCRFSIFPRNKST